MGSTTSTYASARSARTGSIRPDRAPGPDRRPESARVDVVRDRRQPEVGPHHVDEDAALFDRVVERDVGVRERVAQPVGRKTVLADLTVLSLEHGGRVTAQIEAHEADRARAQLALEIVVEEGEVEAARRAADQRPAEAAHGFEPRARLEHRG